MSIATILLTMSLFVLLSFPGAEADPRPTPAECTYIVQTWNVNLRSSGQKRTVRHPYEDISPEEQDALTGCTVCSEDQEMISIPPLQPFPVCRKLAPRVRTVLRDLTFNGAVLNTVEGYRVIRSRGPIDREGNRTEFSNHSYGTAIDINPEQNGLYDNCVSFGPSCRLLRGGEWRPGAAGTLERNSDIVRSFKAAGFKWGGEIAGKQKDFMHFSLTGY